MIESIESLLLEFKKGAYIHGAGSLEQVGQAVAGLGSSALIVRSDFPGMAPFADTLHASLGKQGVRVLCEMINVVRPNAPVEDMLDIAARLKEVRPEVVISMGGGSCIDAVKAAIVLQGLGGDVEDYFGVGKVSAALAESGRQLIPHVAIQTAASSAAHLTKYSNITHLETQQKKLIVDEAVVPVIPVFDYAITYQAPIELSLDGALDGLSHCMEVYFGSVGSPHHERAGEIARLAISLIVAHLPVLLKDSDNPASRDALCMATDLGGYAIMIGGTSGAHLTSFSLVDLMSHGRACALMNPYYAVFYAPAIEEPLRVLGEVYKKAGYSQADFQSLEGRALGLAFAGSMIAFAEKIDFPTRLEQIEGFGPPYVSKALAAAKNPQLKSKLENMPVPLTAGLVDEYMGSILEAASAGELTVIKNL